MGVEVLVVEGVGDEDLGYGLGAEGAGLGLLIHSLYVIIIQFLL